MSSEGAGPASCGYGSAGETWRPQRKSFGEGDAGSTATFADGSFALMAAMLLQGFTMPGLGNLGGLALPVLFFIGLYVLLIVPNQRKQKKWQEMLSGLKSGDQVTTSGGMRGTVLSVKDDVVILRVMPDGLKLEFVKSAISAVTTAGEA